MSRVYSRAVIEGLRRMGYSVQQICRISGVPAAKLKSILESKASFTERQLDTIEEATGKGSGQIVALTVKDRELAKIINDLGKLTTDHLAYKKSHAAKSA